jgi:site-specific recombinase XerC
MVGLVGVVFKLGCASGGGGRMPADESDDLRQCGSDDLAVVVSWEHDGTALSGQVIAENVSGRACRLRHKPGVTPLQSDGTPRELRHSFVSLISDADVPIEHISRLVGHSSTTTTETIYRKQIRPVIVHGADVMDRIFSGEADHEA